MKRVSVTLLALVTACTVSPQPPPHPNGRDEATAAICPTARNLVPDTALDEPHAFQAAQTFMDRVSRRDYDADAAWAMLDASYLDRMGWASASEFASSDVGQPYPFAHVSVSSHAGWVADVGGPGTLSKRKYRDFLLARASITARECSERSRKRLARSTWFLTVTPDGGNGPAYVLVVHRPRGYRVLSSDI